MRIRTIKPEFWTDALSGEWDARLALFYVGIWQAADDSGRLRLDARLVRADLDPFDAKFGGTEGVAELLAELVRLGRLLPYEVDGQRLGLVAHFAQHQVINKPTKSRLPPPPDSLPDHYGSPTVALLPKDGVEGKGKEGIREQGRDLGEACAESVADAPAPAPASPVVFTFKCSGKGSATYDVTEAQVAEWSAAYPGVNVIAELRKSAAWQDANPTKRKTHRGMAAHLVSWLNSQQNKGGRSTFPTAQGQPQFLRPMGPPPDDNRRVVGFDSSGSPILGKPGDPWIGGGIP